MLVQYVECEEAGKVEDAAVDDDFDAELYGGSKTHAEPLGELPPIRYRVCDSLLVTGPIRDMTIGGPAEYSAHPYQGASLNLEVVACTGECNDGAITVLHNSVLPQILSSFELKDVNDLWPIKISPESDSAHHTYLVLSRDSATSVCEIYGRF
jgi:cleavage and polyadenylation specificity factor subunit 1